MTEHDLSELGARLERLDRGGAPWAMATLHLIEKYPGVAGSALARRTGHDLASFKSSLRKLQDLGVTERSGTGHRLTPLGVALLQQMR